MKIGNNLLLDEKEIFSLYVDIDKWKTIKGVEELKSAGLLPLKISYSESFRHLVHVLGLRYSDGCIYYQKRNNSYTFYICFGKRIDAYNFIRDCKRIWHIDLRSHYSTRAHYVYIPASIARLIIAIGSPAGKKTSQLFRIPKWVFSMPNDLKWELMSGIFTGDGSSPRLQPQIQCSYSLKLSLSSENKIVGDFCNGFMKDIWLLLKSLRIKSISQILNGIYPEKPKMER